MARRTTSGHTAAPLNSRRIMTILPEGRVGYTIHTSDWARNCRSRPFTCQHLDFGRAARGDVALAPDVILTNGAAASAPLLQATRSVPVVFVLVADPVGAGFVDSLPDRAATPPALPRSNTALAAKGWNCSKRSRRA
jgi:hypothetical protein